MNQYPTYVPPGLTQEWSNVYTTFGGGAQGLYAANSWLTNRVEVKTYQREAIAFKVDTEQGFLKRSDDGEEYVTLTLATDQPHSDGKRYTPELLKRWAELINSNSIIADVDHELYDSLLKTSRSDEEIKAILKNKPGIAKSVKAFFENGKLFVRAFIDKRYRKIVEKSKGVSAEAFVSYGPDGKSVIDGDLLGFTFNVLTTPADQTAVMI